ncbi:MAG: FISUMP domain-containing protein [Candidatus Zixiibacteriota bacterium]
MKNVRTIRWSCLVLILIILTLGLSCSKNSSDSTGPDHYTLALEIDSAPPGTIVAGSVTGFEATPSNAVVLFDSIGVPMITSDNGSFSFYTPPLPAGRYEISVIDTLSRSTDTLEFTIQSLPATGFEPGEILNQTTATTNDLIDGVRLIFDNLKLHDLVTADNSTRLNSDLDNIANLLDGLNEALDSLSDSSLALVEGFMFSSGITDLFGVTGNVSPLKSNLESLKASLDTKSEYALSDILIKADNLSMVISDVRPFLSAAGITILVSTIGVGGPATAALHVLNLSLGVVDNVLDGYIPTDLDSLRVSFEPTIGDVLYVGGQADVIVEGYFNSQKDPIAATVDLVLMGYAEYLSHLPAFSEKMDKIILDIVTRMGISISDNLITIQKISVPNPPVLLDIHYFGNPIRHMFENIGCGYVYDPVRLVAAAVGINLDALTYDPIVFNGAIATYTEETRRITAITEGTLDQSNITILASVNKPVCSGVFSFLCLGIEWPRNLDPEACQVVSTTIGTGQETGTVTDIDENVYQTVRIGDQWWMAENLKVKRYRNGDPIRNVTENSTWSSLTTGAYCEYDNDPANVDMYGRLYNWYAVDDSRRIAPEGWHVPTDDEWKQLEMYLGMSQAEADAIGIRGTDEGGKLKEAGTTHWNPPNTGATNESGFTALPGGGRYDHGEFASMVYDADFWCSTEIYSSNAWMRTLRNSFSGVDRSNYNWRYGFAVRCLRD